MTVTHGKTIPYVDDTITKRLWRTLMRLVLAFSLYECLRVAVSNLKANATVHVHKSEQQFLNKHVIKTQPSHFKTVQF